MFHDILDDIVSKKAPKAVIIVSMKFIIAVYQAITKSIKANTHSPSLAK